MMVYADDSCVTFSQQLFFLQRTGWSKVKTAVQRRSRSKQPSHLSRLDKRLTGKQSLFVVVAAVVVAAVVVDIVVLSIEQLFIVSFCHGRPSVPEEKTALTMEWTEA